MSKQIKIQTGFDYWLWNNFFNKKEIKEFNKLLKNFATIKESETKAAHHLGKKIKFLKTFILPLSKVSKFTDKIISSVHYINQKHFGYDLHYGFEFGDWGNYNIYSSKTKDNYDWHHDVSRHPLYDTKFTVLINLSESKYTGGDLKFFNQVEYSVDDFKSGSVIMFKSHLNHKVTPVIKGERKTFTIFFTGPTWK